LYILHKINFMANCRKQTLDFIKKSRDDWKDKTKESKKYIKYLKIKIRDLENSRELWKNQAIALKNDSVLKKTKVTIPPQKK
jgi:hypothetical protein